MTISLNPLNNGEQTPLTPSPLGILQDIPYMTTQKSNAEEIDTKKNPGF